MILFFLETNLRKRKKGELMEREITRVSIIKQFSDTGKIILNKEILNEDSYSELLEMLRLPKNVSQVIIYFDEIKGMYSTEKESQ